MLWLSAGLIVAAQNGGDPLEPVRQSAILPAASPILTLSRRLPRAVPAGHCAASNGFDGDALRAGRPAGRPIRRPVVRARACPVVAEASGSYRLEIRPLNQTATRGAYQLKVEELRAPTPQDRARVVAIKASTEGKRLIEQGGAQSYKLAKESTRRRCPVARDRGSVRGGADARQLGFLLWRLGGRRRSSALQSGADDQAGDQRPGREKAKLLIISPPHTRRSARKNRRSNTTTAPFRLDGPAAAPRRRRRWAISADLFFSRRYAKGERILLSIVTLTARRRAS